MNYGLTTSQIEAICSVLECYEEIEQAVLYGSRAMGTFEEWSDIDLTLKGVNVTSSQLNVIDDKIDDLMLPYFMDVSVYNLLKNAELVSHIDRVGKVLYEREKKNK